MEEMIMKNEELKKEITDAKTQIAILKANLLFQNK